MASKSTKSSPEKIAEICLSSKHIAGNPSENLFQYCPYDFTEVVPKIFISGRDFALNIQEIQNQGISHVLNVAQGKKFMHVDTSADAYPPDIRFLGIPAVDSLTYDLGQHSEDCFSFMDEALNSGGAVLVHCSQGLSRSPTVVTAYLMRTKGYSAVDAVEIVRNKRKILPNEGFRKMLCGLEQSLRFKHGIQSPKKA